jgi:hypothetical protein
MNVLPDDPAAIESAVTPDISHFVALETRVWQALAEGDAEADLRLLDPEFTGVYASGIATRDEHAAQLSGGPSVESFSIGEPRLLRLAPGAVLLCYRATFRRINGKRSQNSQTMYVSSVWRQHGGQWVNIFSQDTLAGETGEWERATC